MPSVSEAQRRAMGAAASGKSNLDIPKSVGKEFIEADPGGHLPAHAKDSRFDTQLDACADAMNELRKDARSLKSRMDAWSDEAREAAAKARGGGSGDYPNSGYKPGPSGEYEQSSYKPRASGEYANSGYGGSRPAGGS